MRNMISIQWAASIFILLICFNLPYSQAQQVYVGKEQSDCTNPNTTATLGNICNGVNTSCTSYLTFHSSPPLYSTPATIASLLNSIAANIAAVNNISTVNSIPANTTVIVPVNCSCSGNGDYYQYNSSYILKQGQQYSLVASDTYQGLTSCQALQAQNPYQATNLPVGLNLTVPLRCACPTSEQISDGFKYLLTYLISEGDMISSIAQRFGVDEQSISDANDISLSSTIYFSTPLIVPLKEEPTGIQLVSPPPPPPPPPTNENGDSDSSKKWVIVGVTVGAALILLLFLFGFFIFYRRRRRRSQHPLVEAKLVPASATDATKNSSDYTTESWSLSSEGIRYAIDSLTIYKFEDLQKAVNFFSEANKIKGTVYRASFNGDSAAIKVLNGDVSGEINILKRINHTSVIRLSGFCVHKGRTYLVYEFAENGSLDDWLHSDKSLKLSWKQRVQIAYDIADALNYLHNYTNPSHIHKNLNGSNVLLDGNFRGKVSNFALSRALDDGEDNGFQLTRHVVGTQGYMAPEYVENGVITPKMDVFAFGVVILELLSGREAIVRGRNEGEELLSASVNEVFDGENVSEKLQAFMDPSLKEEYPFDLAYSMGQTAKICIAGDINSRPNMSEVLMTLSKIQSSTLGWDPSTELQQSRSFGLGRMADNGRVIL